MDVTDPTKLTSDARDSSAAWQVFVANQQSALPVDPSQLQAAVRAVLCDSKYQTASISVALVDDPTIHRLNREYLQHDYPTDVLSFVLEEDGTHLEGELIVSADTAVDNAAEYGWTASEELLLYVVHGALHLVGYRDKLSSERAAMQAAEAEHLRRLGIVLPTGESRWQREGQKPDRTPTLEGPTS